MGEVGEGTYMTIQCPRESSLWQWLRYSYKPQKLWGKCLWTRFGTGNHLTLIACFPTYKKRVRSLKWSSNTCLHYRSCHPRVEPALMAGHLHGCLGWCCHGLLCLLQQQQQRMGGRRLGVWAALWTQAVGWQMCIWKASIAHWCAPQAGAQRRGPRRARLRLQCWSSSVWEHRPWHHAGESANSSLTKQKCT